MLFSISISFKIQSSPIEVFGPRIFDAVNKIKPSFRNELEITDAIQTLVSDKKKVEVEKVSSWWKDTGKPEDLLEANQLVLSDLESSIEGEVSENASLTGKIALGKNSKIMEGVNIRGPVIIGNNCTIGPNVFVGP